MISMLKCRPKCVISLPRPTCSIYRTALIKQELFIGFVSSKQTKTNVDHRIAVLVASCNLQANDSSLLNDTLLNQE